jgi:hypothetical protein
MTGAGISGGIGATGGHEFSEEDMKIYSTVIPQEKHL